MSHLFQTIITQPLFNLLILFTVWIPGHSLGWAIILVTVLMRAALIPSATQQFTQQAKMREFQPELKRIQERYASDKEAQTRETMALYQKHNINPVGSCLPLLIQLPILFGLYRVFIKGIDTSHFNLLYAFVPHPASINSHFLLWDLAKPDHWFILPILAGLLQFFQSRLLLRDTLPQGDNDTQKILNAQLTYFMPLLTIFISYRLPAALPLYWVVTTLFGIIQQQLIYQRLGQGASMTPAPIAATTSSAPVASAPNGAERHGTVSVSVRKKK